MKFEKRLAAAEEEIKSLKKQLEELAQSTSCLLHSHTADIQSVKSRVNSKAES